MEMEKIELPKELASELKKINWEKVTATDIQFLKNFVPLLKLKGYFKK